MAEQGNPTPPSLFVTSLDGQQERFARLYSERRLCDLVLTAAEEDGSGRKEFHVHRCFLATTSDYWEGLLGREGFVEAGQARVGLEELSAHTLGLLLNCVYGIPCHVGPRDCIDLINAADKYVMDGLQQRLVAKFLDIKPPLAGNEALFMSVVLAANDTTNEPAYPPAKRKRLADEESETHTVEPLLCADKQVVDYCTHKLKEGAGDIMRKDDLLKQAPPRVMELLMSYDRLDMEEIDIFRAGKKWAETTGHDFDNVAVCVRYPAMTDAQLHEVSLSGVVSDKVLLLAYRTLSSCRTDYGNKPAGLSIPTQWFMARRNKRLAMRYPNGLVDSRCYSDAIDVNKLRFRLIFQSFVEHRNGASTKYLGVYFEFLGPVDGAGMLEQTILCHAQAAASVEVANYPSCPPYTTGIYLLFSAGSVMTETNCSTARGTHKFLPWTEAQRLLEASGRNELDLLVGWSACRLSAVASRCS